MNIFKKLVFLKESGEFIALRNIQYHKKLYLEMNVHKPRYDCGGRRSGGFKKFRPPAVLTRSLI